MAFVYLPPGFRLVATRREAKRGRLAYLQRSSVRFSLSSHALSPGVSPLAGQARLDRIPIVPTVWVPRFRSTGFKRPAGQGKNVPLALSAGRIKSLALGRRIRKGHVASISAHDERARIPESSFKDRAAATVQNQQPHGVRMMLKNRHLQSHRPAHSPSRLGLAIVGAAALAYTLFAGPIHAAAAAKPSPGRRSVENSPSTPEEVMEPWTGDLDGMIAAADHSRTDGLQQDFLFCRQRYPARRDLRHISPVRGGTEQETGKGATS